MGDKWPARAAGMRRRLADQRAVEIQASEPDCVWEAIILIVTITPTLRTATTA